jgi:uncharacterized membrane protein YfcA
MLELTGIIILSFFVTGIGTLAGFGSSAILVPILLLWLPFEEVLLLAGIVHWFNDIWEILFFREKIDLKLVTVFGVSGMIAAFIGAKMIAIIPNVLLMQLLGAFFIFYAYSLFKNRIFRLKQNVATEMSGGIISGFMAGSLGIGGPVRGIFLTAFRLPKEVYIGTIGAVALSVDAARLFTYISHGIRLETMITWGLPLIILASFVGAKIAANIVHKINRRTFREIISIFLLVAGIKMLLWP